MPRQSFFLQKFHIFCFYSKILQFHKLEVADLKYENSSLQIVAQGNTNQEFFDPELDISVVLAKLCYQTESRVLNSNIAIVILKFQPKTTQVMQFFFQIELFLFFFHEDLLLGKFESVKFKYDNSFFRLQPKKTYIRHSWSQIERFFISLSKILDIHKFEAVDFKYDNNF